MGVLCSQYSRLLRNAWTDGDWRQSNSLRLVIFRCRWSVAAFRVGKRCSASCILLQMTPMPIGLYEGSMGVTSPRIYAEARLEWSGA